MHAKSKLSGILPKSGFKADKCKTSLKMAMARIKLLRNKRDVQIKQLRRDLAQLLESGQDQTARIRVEHVIREEKTVAAYELIELYCELIVSRLPIIESQKNCPIDLREAISSVLFASPRCADIPELMDVKKHFSSKYGKDFTTAALELRPECGVNRLIVEKLSATAPDLETKINTLISVAEEHNVNWDSKAFREQMQKPNDDLLSGTVNFPSASKIVVPEHSTNVQGVFENSKDELISSIPPQNSTKVEIFSHENMNGAGTISNSLPPHSHPKMEFKDVKSAAKAAAESAERARFAARAAAELAALENESFSVSRTNTVNDTQQEVDESVKPDRDSMESDKRSEIDYTDEELEHTSSRTEHRGQYGTVWDKGEGDNRQFADSSCAVVFDQYDSDIGDHAPFEEHSKAEVNYEDSNLVPNFDSDGPSSEEEDELSNIFSAKMNESKLTSDSEKRNQKYETEPDFNDETELGFKFGKITGGLRNKGRHPSFVTRTGAGMSSTSLDSPSVEGKNKNFSHKTGESEKEYKSSSKMGMSYFDTDDSEEEEMEMPRQIVVRGQNRGVVEHSRRTENDKLKVEKDVAGNLEGEEESVRSMERESLLHKGNLEGEEESVRSMERESLLHKGNLEPGEKDSDKSSVRTQHPKLPDYDSFAAHFHSLRSNRG